MVRREIDCRKVLPIGQGRDCHRRRFVVDCSCVQRKTPKTHRLNTLAYTHLNTQQIDRLDVQTSYRRVLHITYNRTLIPLDHDPLITSVVRRRLR